MKTSVLHFYGSEMYMCTVLCCWKHLTCTRNIMQCRMQVSTVKWLCYLHAYHFCFKKWIAFWNIFFCTFKCVLLAALGVVTRSMTGLVSKLFEYIRNKTYQIRHNLLPSFPELRCNLIVCVHWSKCVYWHVVILLPSVLSLWEYIEAVHQLFIDLKKAYDSLRREVLYKVVQIWPGRFVCKQVTVCPDHIWTTLYYNNNNNNNNTRWFKYDQDCLCVNKSQFVPVIFEPPCNNNSFNLS
jgi:hypothetical protein